VLENRVVKVSAQPYDAHVFINGADQGTNVVMAEVKKDATITVEVRKPGFNTKSRTYHNRQTMDVPPVEEQISLTERVMVVKTAPTDVQVVVDGKKTGEGNTEVIIPLQGCVTVEYVKDGFVTLQKQYCAKEGQAAPPITENIA